MKKFLSLSLLISAPAIVILWMLWVLPLILAPQSDPNLGRLFHHDHSSLICGTSRTEQGIDPEHLAIPCKELQGIYNFSFNLGDSPWSSQYAAAIANKLSQARKSSHGILILAIDPWNLHNARPNPSPFLGARSTNRLIQTHMYALSTSPLQWITGNSNKELSKALITAIKSSRPIETELKASGWLPNTRFRDSAFTAMETKKKINRYLSLYPRSESWPEKEAINALKSTILNFQKEKPNGTIVLLRPPVRTEMLLIENTIYPELNELAEALALQNEAVFIDGNIISDGLVFNDAHHLYFESAKIFSRRLGNLICNLIQE